MFTVPGWSVPAEALKTQTLLAIQSATSGAAPKDEPKPSKKRKRGQGQSHGVNVTSENLAELWEKHIEGKTKRKNTLTLEADGNEKSKDRKKKRRKNVDMYGEDSEKADTASTNGEATVEKKSDRKVSPTGKARDSKSKIPTTVNGHASPTEAPKGQAAAQKPEIAGKAKYEDRMRKKQERTALKASGTLPPSRPPATTNGDTDHTATATQPTAQQDDSRDFKQPATQKKIKKSKAKEKSDTSPQEEPPAPSPSFKDNSSPTTNNNLKTKPSKSNSKLSSHQPVPQTSTTTSPSTIAPTTASLPTKPTPPSLPQNLTPLQRTMAQKLLSSRFRHLNQTLYTTPSISALNLFTTTPSAYTAYHAGFRAQVAVWPQNPVEGFISDLKTRGKVRKQGLGAQKNAWRAEKKGKKKGGEQGPQGETLPRTRGLCTIADLGCGDATLAASLSSSLKDLNLKIHSFDLAKGDGPNKDLITAADVTRLPLREGEVDVAICCLSLMGTNWVDVVEDCGRVVRSGGEVWVAEIKSRFARPGRQRQDPKQGIGKKKQKGKKGGEEEEEEGPADPREVVEVDSDPDILVPGGKRKRGKEQEETDVGGFVEVWRRRGFELKGEVDLSNKMFVRMRFEKRKEKVGGMEAGRGKAKFVDGEGDGVSKEEEAKVLKPCVYKLR